MKIGDKVERNGRDCRGFVIGNIYTVKSVLGGFDSEFTVEEHDGVGMMRYFKLVVEEPWTPKNGEVVKTPTRKDPVKFIGMCNGHFVCKEPEGFPSSYSAWPLVVQLPTQDPRLTAAQAENTQLKADINDLKSKLKEILDKIERVS